MRVLHLIAPGRIAGAERVILTGLPALQQVAHVGLGAFIDARDTSLGELFVDAALQAQIGDVRRLPCHGRIDPTLVAKLRECTTGGHWDVVHTHGYKALAYTALAVAGARRQPAIVATHHGDTRTTPAVRAYESIARLAYRRTQAVVAVSSAVGLALTADGVPRVAVIDNPVGGVSEVAPPPASSTVRLVVTARLVPEKGVDVLLDALSDPRLARVSLVIVGDGPARSALEAQAASLQGRVRFVGWASDPGPYVQSADAMVLPSRREGLPISVLEALVQGRPVIASRVGGIPEVVEHGVTGLLVAPGDSKALADALHDFAEARDRFAAASMGAAGATALRFGPTRWAERTLALYDQVLGDAS
ncbi:MAG: glycosyltransferase [Myxococcales bacterium]|nr:glycosyltransferase [Myxococcales bacterium]